jgi:hypothetical protein
MTTYLFYSLADDYSIASYGYSSSIANEPTAWAAARNGTSGLEAQYMGQTVAYVSTMFGYNTPETPSDGWFYANQLLLAWDTSALPVSPNIQSAGIRMRVLSLDLNRKAGYSLRTFAWTSASAGTTGNFRNGSQLLGLSAIATITPIGNDVYSDATSLQLAQITRTTRLSVVMASLNALNNIQPAAVTGGVECWWYVSEVGTGSSPRLSVTLVDTTPPVITSPNSATVSENIVLYHSCSADETVTWSIVGGVDQTHFYFSGSTLIMDPKDFENPSDSNADNLYVVIIRATDTNGNWTNQTFTAQVLNVVHPTFYSAGTPTSSTTFSISPSASAMAGDLCLLFVETNGLAVTTPSGWTLVDSVMSATGTTQTRLTVFRRFATTNSVSASVASPGDHVIAGIMSVSEVDSINPINAIAFGNGTGATDTISLPAVTTTERCLIVNAVSSGQDTGTGRFSTYTIAGGRGSLLATRFNTNTASGDGGGFGVATWLQNSTGDSGQTTVFHSGSGLWSAMTIALNPIGGSVAQNKQIRFSGWI